MKPRPYIGITGFKSEEEVVNVGKQFERGFDRYMGGFDSYNGLSHTAMFGFLSSSKRLADIDKGGKQSPPISGLARLVSSTPDYIIPMIHYFTNDRHGLADEIKRLYASLTDGDDSRPAMQLNVDWPPPEEIRDIKESLATPVYSSVYEENDRSPNIVLQLPSRAMEGMTDAEIVSRVKEYEGMIEYVLIDPSGGKGKNIHDGEFTDLMDMLNVEMRDVTVGIAGGFSGENVSERVKLIRNRFEGEFFIDAQGKLRTDGELDMQKVEKYIRNAAGSLM